MMDAKKRERIDAQVMTALNRGITSRKSISQTTGIDALDVAESLKRLERQGYAEQMFGDWNLTELGQEFAGDE